MKAKLGIIVGLLVIGIALMIAPAMAVDTGTAAVKGNPESFVSISLTNSTINMPLNAAVSPALNQTGYIIISSNSPFAIKSEDNSGRDTTQGKGFMGNFTSAAYLLPPDYTLTNLTARLSFTGNSNSTTTGAGPDYFDGGPVVFWSGPPISAPRLLTSTFSQVVTGTDLRLQPGNYYRIDLLFTIYATG